MAGRTKAKKAANAEHRATVGAARQHRRPVVRGITAAAELADQPPLVAISLAVLAGGAVLRRPPLARIGARMLASHLLATAIKTVVKSQVDRTRPAKALADGAHHVGKGRGKKDGAHNSFPSGHTAGIVAVAEAIAHEAPRLTVPARAAAAMVGAAQLPRGRHYPTDVAAGAAIGWLAERVVGGAFDLATRALRRETDRRNAGDSPFPR